MRKAKKTKFQVGDTISITEHGSRHLRGIRRTPYKGEERTRVSGGQLATIVEVYPIIGGAYYDVRLLTTGKTIHWVPERTAFGFRAIKSFPDPKLETSRKTPPITERRAGLGRGKSPRITPKTPRLRR